MKKLILSMNLIVFILIGCASTNISNDYFVIEDEVNSYVISNNDIVKETHFEEYVLDFDSFLTEWYLGEYDYKGNLNVDYGITLEGYERLLIILTDWDKNKIDLFMIYNYSNKKFLLNYFSKYHEKKYTYIKIYNLIYKDFPQLKNSNSIEIICNEVTNVHKMCYLGTRYK